MSEGKLQDTRSSPSYIVEESYAIVVINQPHKAKTDSDPNHKSVESERFLFLVNLQLPRSDC